MSATKRELQTGRRMGHPTASVLIGLAVIGLVFAVLAGACRPRVPAPTLEGARQFADDFMRERQAGEVAAAQARLNAAARATYEQQQGMVLDLAALGDVTGVYHVESAPAGRGVFAVTYRIHQVAGEVVYAAYWDETLTVAGTGGTYIIDAASKGVVHEAYASGDTVTMHIGDQEVTLFGLAELPDEFVPMGATPDTRFGVGKEGFILLAFSPSGDRLAFVTWGTHGFLGTATVPAGEPSGLDLHYSGLTIDARWSDDGQYLAAVIDAATGNRALMLYHTQPAEKINLGLELQFPPEDYEVFRPRWTGAAAFTFEVRTAGGGTDAVTGSYSADVVSREIRRLP